MKSRENGITLISLGVTIIVMIILAAVAINLSVGDGGIIGLTGNTVNGYENATEQEQEGLKNFVDEFNEILNGGEQTGEGGNPISERPEIEITGWNETGGIVSISTIYGYTTQYRIGSSGEWKNYSTSVNVNNGETIYAKYTQGNNTSATVSKVIEDTMAPTITGQIVSVDGSSIAVKVTGTSDEGMGMPEPPTYTYYYKLKTESYYTRDGSNTTGEYTYEGLVGNSTYDIRISTTDRAGNVGSVDLTATTEVIVDIPDLVKGENIIFTKDPSTPTKENVNVTITVPGISEPLYIEYKIDNGTWTRYDEPVEMTDNGRVYARVTDGEEYSNEVYEDITNIDRNNPTATLTITNTTSKSLTATVSNVQDDNLPTTVQYNWYIKKSSDLDYPSSPTFTGAATTREFNYLDDGTEYTVRVTFTDSASNEGEATKTGSTIKVPDLVQGSNTTISISETRITNEPVTVTISTTATGAGSTYTLQYSTNGSSYTNYTGSFSLDHNTTIYARLWDEKDSNENVGESAQLQVTNIDTSLSDLEVLIERDEPVEENTTVTDERGNEITIPDGFKPLPDDGDSNTTIDDGVVIEDKKGNQFVWIPVGTITTNTGSRITINYDRYAFSNWYKQGTDSTSYQAQIKTTSSASQYFTEELNSSEKQSAEDNGGFYLARYEAGVESSSARTASSGTSAEVLSQAGKNVYNYVTQSQAKSLASSMYSNENYTSNLTSSYAWDTALQFLNLTGNSSYLTNSSQGNYYNTRYGGKTQTNASTLIETGQTTAVKHLYDMGGNVYEWTTEKYSDSSASKVARGGFYGFLSTDEPAIGRFSASNTSDQAIGFRVALFIGAVDEQTKYMGDLQIGDYVAYTPEGNNYYGIDIPQFTGYDDNGTIYKEDLSWRVLSINDDGTVDLISATPLSYTVGFGGALGYNNSVFLLNNVCSSLYSNSSLGATARSINLEEDIEPKLNAAGISARNSYGRGQVYAYGNVRTYSNGRYYPNLYAQEIGSGINTGVAREDGIAKNESYYNPPTYESYTQAGTSLTATSDYYTLGSASYFDNEKLYDLLFNTSTDYWLASRSVMLSSNYAGFSLRKVSGGNLSVGALYDSEQANHNYSDSNSLRPVVSLNSNIALGNGDGKTPSTAYEIIG